jgi:adenylate cyclase
MAEEIELKLALTDSASRALLRHPLLASAEKLPTRRLRNIYLDTPGLDLHARGMAVRLRRQGRRWLQTVKCAGTTSEGLSKRPEWEYPYGGMLDFSPIDDPEIREWIDRPEIRERLGPVFETNFTRRQWRLRNVRSESVLLVLDRGTISAGGRSEPILEIELELERGGDAGTLMEVADALKARVPFRPEPLSKAERGYRLYHPATE